MSREYIRRVVMTHEDAFALADHKFCNLVFVGTFKEILDKLISMSEPERHEIERLDDISLIERVDKDNNPLYVLLKT